ncbi:MAG TPA: EAL domain-containing protein [Candidatus Sulfotelmatobacter sp.]|nr:EAL domain-containing protein [Candidatus Sulfotelmatobacter sp.]
MTEAGHFLIKRFHQIEAPSRTVKAAVLMLLLWLGAAAVLAHELVTSEQREWELALAESQNLTQLLERQMVSTVEKLDLVLKDLADDMSAALSAPGPMPDVTSTNLKLHEIQQRVPEIRDQTLRVIGADGYAIYQANDNDTVPDANVSDRSYFLRLKADPAAGLVMSEPLQSRFLNGEWIISFARPLRARNGAFKGLVMASLKIADLQKTAESLDLGGHGVIGMFDGQMRMIARTPLGSGQIGFVYPITEVAQVLAEGKTKGSFVNVSPIDGLKRQYVFTKLAFPPLVIVAGRAPADFLEEWRHKRALFGISLIIMLGQIAALVLQLRRQDRMARDHIDHLVTHDVLTQLPNRLSLESMAVPLSGDDPSQPMALIILDIDNFKNVNDMLGHDAGDLLLCAASERLLSLLPSSAKLWRHGGDEFVVILTDDCGPDRVADLTRTLLAELAEPMFLARQEIEITASAGIALKPLHGTDVSELLRGAEAAMYEAKHSGRAGYRFFSEEMRSAISERMLIENHLRKAIARNQLRLFYQPQYNLESGRLVGFEALVRWQHPEMGLVSPARFIPVAEETGMIVPIGEWVLNEACRQTRQWELAGLPDVVMAVNLAAQQFRQLDLMPQIAAILHRHELSAERLALEVTESSLMNNVDQVIATLERLKSLGLSIAIDDFGTGYSSLSYLKQFPIDKIKIDQSFIRGMAQSAGDDAIVQAVIAIAAKMKLTTIAEGVETRQHLEHLRQLGCDEVQGFYYSKPVPAADAERFLRGEAAASGRC